MILETSKGLIVLIDVVIARAEMQGFNISILFFIVHE